MKYLFFVLLILGISSQYLLSQTPNCEVYYYSYSDTLICCNYLEYKQPQFQGNYFIIDNKRVAEGKVKFFKDNTGFYGNKLQSPMSGKSEFFKRYQEGKINLYEKVITTTHTPMGPNGMPSGSFSQSRVKFYYNVGFENLKKANYRNLLIDLSDNQESVNLLRKYKNLQVAEFACYITSLAFFVGTIIKDVNKSEEARIRGEEYNPKYTGFYFAVGFSLGGTISSLSKPRFLRDAVKVYNNK